MIFDFFILLNMFNACFLFVCFYNNAYHLQSEKKVFNFGKTVKLVENCEKLLHYKS